MFADPTNAPAVETPSSAPTPPAEQTPGIAPATTPAGEAASAGTTAPPSPNGDFRDSRGRFGPKNPGGPGNPFARQVAALRQAVLDAVSADDMQKIVRKLIELAAAGNVPAARLLLSYALGKPAAAVDPDTLDAQEWEGYRRVPDPAGDLRVMTTQIGRAHV